MKLKNYFKNLDWVNVILIIGIILLIAIIIFCIGISIYCFITYGNKPIDEIPSWALIWMFGSRK